MKTKQQILNACPTEFSKNQNHSSSSSNTDTNATMHKAMPWGADQVLGNVMQCRRLQSKE